MEYNRSISTIPKNARRVREWFRVRDSPAEREPTQMLLYILGFLDF